METCFTDTTIRDKTQTEDSLVCKSGQLATWSRPKEVDWRVKVSGTFVFFSQFGLLG